MANPQPVPFVRFSKELLEAYLLNPPATVAAGQLWLWVLLNTWGNFGKDETKEQSVREIARAVGVAKSTAHRDLDSLVRCRRLKRGDNGGFAIQKDYDLWRQDHRKRSRAFTGPAQLPLEIELPAVPTVGTKTVPQVGTKVSRRWGRNRPTGGDSTVPQVGTPIRNENTGENKEPARKGADQKLLPNGKTDTPRHRADFGHDDFAPEDHKDFDRMTFKMKDELNATWKDAKKATACVRGCGRRRASDSWPYCRGCTVCHSCKGTADGTRKFQKGPGGILCTACADTIK